MKNIKTRLAAWIGLLAVCLLPIGAGAADQQTSGICGLVEAPNWHVRVYSEVNNVLVYAQPDREGFFKVDLQPGVYVVTPITIYVPAVGPGQALPNFVMEIPGPSRTVKVAKNRFAFVVLPVKPNDLPLLTGSPSLPALSSQKR